jgi:NAD(P)-dependent dehydrogenase (short-subunit alcohol dehydrogenase family)
LTRNVLVTGASGGIGRAIAERFASEGDTVVITGRNTDRLSQAAAELGAHGIACDATDPAQVAALVGSLAERIGSALDVVVNNAGGNTDFDSAVDDSSDANGLTRLAARWRANLDANLLSAVLTTYAVADRLAPGGSVISIGTIGAERGGGSYGAAKAALAAWNADLSAEIGPSGITANVISAGYIEGTGFFRDRMTPQRREALIAAAHDRRPGRPGDIAQTALFLASPGARHITGQTIHVNGGAFTTR